MLKDWERFRLSMETSRGCRKRFFDTEKISRVVREERRVDFKSRSRKRTMQLGICYENKSSSGWTAGSVSLPITSSRSLTLIKRERAAGNNNMIDRIMVNWHLSIVYDNGPIKNQCSCWLFTSRQRLHSCSRLYSLSATSRCQICENSDGGHICDAK